MVAESVVLIEREELAGPDYYPTHPDLQKWAHEAGSAYIGDQKVRVQRRRLQFPGIASAAHTNMLTHYALFCALISN